MILKPRSKKFFRKRKSIQNKWNRTPKKKLTRNLTIRPIETELITNRETMTYAEAQKFVDVEDADGEIQRLNIEESIEISNTSISANEKQLYYKNSFCDLKAKVEILDEDYEINSRYNFKLPKSYIRAPCSLKSEGNHIEYDADAQDISWLKLINAHQRLLKLSPITLDNLENVFQQFEKESFQISLEEACKPKPVVIDELMTKTCKNQESVKYKSIIDAPSMCEICRSNVSSSNMLKCESCGIIVHLSCFAFIVPERRVPWICDLCQHIQLTTPQCCICPSEFKIQYNTTIKENKKKVLPLMIQQSINQWVHARCLAFSKASLLESEKSIRNNPRIKNCCSSCMKSAVGFYLHCQSVGCRISFHIMCAHLCRAMLKLPSLKNEFNTESQGDRPTILCYKHSKMFKRKLIKKTKSELKLPREDLATQVIIPTMPVSKINSDRLFAISECLHAKDKNYVMERLHSYWFLKRKSRRGFHLISHFQQMLKMIECPKIMGPKEASIDYASFKLLKKMRQQWEKARLLMELIRKREKLKREHLKYIEREIMMRLTPEIHFFNRLLDQLQLKDNLKIFAHPVPAHLVPGYLDKITHPMDYSTIRCKINRHEYQLFSDFEIDFHLIINNCLTFNEKDSSLHAYALKHQKNCEHIIMTSREMFDHCKSANNITGSKKQESNCKMTNTNGGQTPNFCTNNDIRNLVATDSRNQFDIKSVLLEPNNVKTRKISSSNKSNFSDNFKDCNDSANQSTILLSTSQIEKGIEESKIEDIDAETNILKRELQNLLASLDIAVHKNGHNLVKKRLRKRIRILRQKITNLNKFNDSASERTLLYPLDNQQDSTNKNPNFNLLTRLPISYFNNQSHENNFCTHLNEYVDNMEQALTPISDNCVLNKDISIEGVVSSVNSFRGMNISERHPIKIHSTPSKLKLRKHRKKFGKKSSPFSNSKALKIMAGNLDYSVKNKNVLYIKSQIKNCFVRISPFKYKKSRPAKNRQIGQLTRLLRNHSSNNNIVSRENSNKGITSSLRSRKNMDITKNPDNAYESKRRGNICANNIASVMHNNITRQLDKFNSTEDLVCDSSDINGVELRSEYSDMNKEGGEEADSSYESSYSLDSDRSLVKSIFNLNEIQITSIEKPHKTKSVCSADAEDIATEIFSGDIVWSKMKGFPWYPAQVVIDASGNSGSEHPPSSILNSKPLNLEDGFLVKFFDRRKNWQWLSRNKLDLLGVNSVLDKYRIEEVIRKQAKIDLKRAYKEAVGCLHVNKFNK